MVQDEPYLETAPPEFYRGRFAPSPTGPLHFGSLVSALGSYLDAKSLGGEWLVRIEDLDQDRNQPGADSEILRCLEGFGLWWDGEVVYQTHRQELYEFAFESLRQMGLVYPCGCTRSEAASTYSGRCRAGLGNGKKERSFRYKINESIVIFNDFIQGKISQDPAFGSGDFVVKRADGPFAYQLAVVVDDYHQGMTRIVRGVDLMESTPRQILLQRSLGYPQIQYAHLPIARNANGEKLSKQTRAPAVMPNPDTLLAALEFLGLESPPAEEKNITEIIKFSIQHFDVKRISKK